ncbi:MAG: hypothetical protein ACXWDO_08040 [Bacteroidia bacterium]
MEMLCLGISLLKRQVVMNRFEKTHEELKRQLASLGIYDSDCPAEVFLAMKSEIDIPDQVPAILLDNQEEQKADVNI